MEKDALTLCRALGYDLNTVEFAVEDGIPYAIDFMNPAPDAEATSVGQENFEWMVNAVAEMAVKKALSDENPARELRWAAFLAGARAGGCRRRRKPSARKKAFGLKSGGQGVHRPVRTAESARPPVSGTAESSGLIYGSDCYTVRLELQHSLTHATYFHYRDRRGIPDRRSGLRAICVRTSTPK